MLNGSEQSKQKNVVLLSSCRRPDSWVALRRHQCNQRHKAHLYGQPARIARLTILADNQSPLPDLGPTAHYEDLEPINTAMQECSELRPAFALFNTFLQTQAHAPSTTRNEINNSARHFQSSFFTMGVAAGGGGGGQLAPHAHSAAGHAPNGRMSGTTLISLVTVSVKVVLRGVSGYSKINSTLKPFQPPSGGTSLLAVKWPGVVAERVVGHQKTGLKQPARQEKTWNEQRTNIEQNTFSKWKTFDQTKISLSGTQSSSFPHLNTF